MISSSTTSGLIPPRSSESSSFPELASPNNKLDIIPKIECPLYFIVGDEDEPRPPKESLEMSKLNKNSKYIVVENAGHISNVDNSKFVNKIFSEIFNL